MGFVFLIMVFFIDHYCAGVSNKHCLQYLSLHLIISDGFVSSKICDKRNDFDFDVVNF